MNREQLVSAVVNAAACYPDPYVVEVAPADFVAAVDEGREAGLGVSLIEVAGREANVVTQLYHWTVENDPDGRGQLVEYAGHIRHVGRFKLIAVSAAGLRAMQRKAPKTSPADHPAKEQPETLFGALRHKV